MTLRSQYCHSQLVSFQQSLVWMKCLLLQTIVFPYNSNLTFRLFYSSYILKKRKCSHVHTSLQKGPKEKGASCMVLLLYLCMCIFVSTGCCTDLYLWHRQGWEKRQKQPRCNLVAMFFLHGEYKKEMFLKRAVSKVPCVKTAVATSAS